MNLHFRLLLILLKSLFAKRIGLLEESHMKYRVWPLDCDFNLHLTNSRYFSLCDVSRFYYMGQVGVLFTLLKRKWLPIAQAQEIGYYKPINPFQRFEIVTRFTHWDEKYWYTEHRFIAAGKLCAVVQVRGVFVHRGKVLPFHDVLAVVDEEVAVPDKPVTVAHWQRLIDSRKES
jgi:acyl-CoA thioesterase FadM